MSVSPFVAATIVASRRFPACLRFHSSELGVRGFGSMGAIDMLARSSGSLLRSRCGQRPSSAAMLFLCYFNGHRPVTTPSQASFEQRPRALEELDDRIHDGANPRQSPEVAMDQQPLVGEDAGDHPADALQPGIPVAEATRQDRDTRAGAGCF